ncbi:DeoR/GlpR family DNA-binding transcription regulator [Vibrio sp. CAU 1672]|uniref:DeoR/GlpR family DNA-binding transcription regulator n=1 Tax=Vibrio sp. CAU 1672 TaxID=3032594 RepID=UPI0023D9DE82|nr:DeoR/GlpR family DNA-binding transcription regulator [Vibrio sp. CAU 1672]MDF2155737.1 DeoR/GlpR family DNA-binding transcription regulator [Vibrio sp. CAU 1672]
MLQQERHNKILELLSQLGRVYATELSVTLQVSEDTIRRDLKQLDEAKLLRRVHGGALPLQLKLEEYRERRDEIDPLKQQVALAAIPFIRENQTILLDSGTTCLHLAMNLPTHFDFTVVTPSPLVATKLIHHNNIELILLGGKVCKPAVMALGATTNEMLRKIHFDACFFGVYAFHPNKGMSINHLDEAETLATIIEQSEQVIALGTSSKLGKMSTYKVCDTNKVDILITDVNTDQNILSMFKEKGVQIEKCAD